MQLCFQNLKALWQQQLFEVSNASPVFTSTEGRCAKFGAEALFKLPLLRKSYLYYSYYQQLYLSQSGLRVENMKFTGQKGREVWPKLGEPGKEVKHGRAKLSLGAVKSGVDNLLAQVFPEALDQVQVGRIRRQKHLANGLVGQPSPRLFVFVVAGIVADDVDTVFIGVGRKQLLVQALRALGADAAGLIEQHLRGLVSVERRVEVNPLAAADGEQGALLATAHQARVQRVLWVG